MKARNGIVIVSFFLLAVIVLLIIQLSRSPSLDDIYPRIGGPGDILVLEGRYFGSQRGNVFVSGERITQQAFLEWSDTRISLRIPDGMYSGLVIVENDQGRSNGVLYAHRTQVPVPRNLDTPQTPPVSRLSSSSVRRGQIIQVNHSAIPSFPSANSLVWSNEDGYSGGITHRIWMGGQISFVVPIWAETGKLSLLNNDELVFEFPVEVLAPRGLSTAVQEYKEDLWSIDYGLKAFFDPLSTEDFQHSRPIAIQTNLPVFQQSKNQGVIDSRKEVNSQSTLSLESDYSISKVYFPTLDEPWIHRIAQVVLVREIKNAFIENQVQLNYTGLEEESLPWIKLNTQVLGVSEEEEMLAIQTRSGLLIARNTNPLRKTRILYDWVIARLNPKFTLESPSAYEVLRDGEGGAGSIHGSYGYSVLLTSLLRGANVPARIIGGLLVLDHDEILPHYWVEALLPEIGWIPLDPSLADGLFQNQSFIPDQRSGFYFGNLDSHHISFGPLGSVLNEPGPGEVTFESIFQPGNRVISQSSTHNLIQGFWLLPALGNSMIDTPLDTLYPDFNSP